MPPSKQNNNGTNHNPGCLAGLLRLLGVHPKPSAYLERPEAPSLPEKPELPEPEDLPYRLRDDFLSNAEASLYQVVKGMLGSYLTVCPKVSLSDILYVPRRKENYQAYHNKIDRKHVDFLICEPKTMRPRFAIELDDASHQRPERMERDAFVDEAFRTAGLPLLRLAVQNAYDTQTLAALFKGVLQPAAQAGGEAARAQDGQAPVCPKCGERMVLREASRGPNAGGRFYGCPNYPKCRGAIAVEG